MNFSIGKRAHSFRHAFRGVVTLIRTQHNAWIHLVATVLVVAAGVWLQVPRSEWALLVIAIGMVWLAEALNTAVEFLGDALSTEHHPLIGRAKDVAAGGVLMASTGAVVIGVLVFWSHICHSTRVVACIANMF